MTILAAMLAACSPPENSTSQAPKGETQVDSIRAEMSKRFGEAPDSLVIHTDARARVAYVDTTSRDLSARTFEEAYAADSLQFDQAFDQAVWLWSRLQQRSDTVSVKFYTIGAQDGSTVTMAEYFFYAKQLSNPIDRPRLDRAAAGPSQRDSVPRR
ncbi:hypothetical protein [Gemmatimonas sp.]|uniref:hypothetical protein n=1 Tax=Gemmatimonas sp. TaxID=1962908 RepID=UPI0033426E5E